MERIVRVLIGNEYIEYEIEDNGNWTDDNTGLSFAVTKEDEGAFYDSGIAMTNNFQAAKPAARSPTTNMR